MDSFCSPTSAHCTYVARVCNKLFDLDNYYVAVEPGQKYSRPAHIAVVKDNVIIDAKGKQSEGVMKDYATAGLRGDEIERADWGKAGLGEQELLEKLERHISYVAANHLNTENA